MSQKLTKICMRGAEALAGWTMPHPKFGWVGWATVHLAPPIAGLYVR